MKITVFGSTGRTGRHVIRGGLQRGHQMVAFTRRPELLHDPSRLARIVVGDGRDPVLVTKAVSGSDGVIAVIGPMSRNGPHHTAEVSRNIIRSMKEAAVRRLVITSAYPIVARRPRLLVGLLRLILASSYRDLAEMEAAVSESELDWTIVRLNRLTNGESTGKVQLSPDSLSHARSLSRASAAAVLLDVVEAKTHSRIAINASGG